MSVVSGNIRRQTTTLPLQIELLYQDDNVAGAFAAATVLTAVALERYSSEVPHSGIGRRQRQNGLRMRAVDGPRGQGGIRLSDEGRAFS